MVCAKWHAHASHIFPRPSNPIDASPQPHHRLPEDRRNGRERLTYLASGMSSTAGSSTSAGGGRGGFRWLRRLRRRRTQRPRLRVRCRRQDRVDDPGSHPSTPRRSSSDVVACTSEWSTTTTVVWPMLARRHARRPTMALGHRRRHAASPPGRLPASQRLTRPLAPGPMRLPWRLLTKQKGSDAVYPRCSAAATLTSSRARRMRLDRWRQWPIGGRPGRRACSHRPRCTDQCSGGR